MIEGNLLIRASAGTGKTFSLATRFIRLMLFDKVEPERIVALTFSRAAAQEIYTALLQRLRKAADAPGGADRERGNLLARLPADKVAEVESLNIAWTPTTFAELLHRVVDTQHTGLIATLDSFILRLVGNFPLELGFQHAVEVLDPTGEKEAVDRAAKAILARPQGADDFAQAFRAAKKGSFSRMCARALDDMMEREGWRKFILDHPECKSWTAESMAQALGISDFGGFDDISATETVRVLDMVADKKAAGWLGKFVDHLVKVTPGETPIPSKSSIPIEFAKAVARHPDKPFVEHRKKAKDGTFEFERCDYPQAVFDAARADLGRLADAFLMRQLEIVEAKIRLFAIIEKEYDISTRRTGKLTFQDFTNAARDDTKLELDNLRFRFDSKLDHWALDEFQDTSEVQWSCLRSLVESAAGSGAGRSVIAVGDLKQSIYTWRGGDDKPFEEMMGWPWFATAYGRIENSKISYRYGKRIADFINRVFDERNIRNGGLIPASRSAATERWLREDCWLEHVPDCKDDGTPRVADYVKVVAVKPDEDPEAGDEVVAALFRELKPVWEEREKAGSSESVGILVRRNEDGAKVAEYLRQRGLPVVWEGMDAVSDMPVVQAVVNLLKLAEHPQDTFAWAVVNRLFPVREILFPALRSANAVSAKLAERLSHQGLARTLKDFCGKLCAGENGLDGLSCSRLRALVRLGVDYERRPSSDYDVDGFARFIASAGKREGAASANAIRILTIHRSKGLTLDRVFVPLFEGSQSSIVEPKQFSALFGRNRNWVLPYLSPDVAALNRETRTVLEEQRDARLLDELRMYYVALTRARKALCVMFTAKEHAGLLFCDLVRKAVGEQTADAWGHASLPMELAGNDVSSVRNRLHNEIPVVESNADGCGQRPSAVFDCLASLGCASACRPRLGSLPNPAEGVDVLFEDGEMPQFAPADIRVKTGRQWKYSRSVPRAERASPSRSNHAFQKSGAKAVSADVLFEREFGSAARHGVDVHAAYRKIEWADAETLAKLPQDFREAFVKPTADASVWRERSYELFDGKLWETGQFDRVVFAGADAMRSATIYDFKTNARGEGEGERDFAERMRNLHASQMEAYRLALCRLTGIPVERIVAKLFLEATGRVVVV